MCFSWWWYKAGLTAATVKPINTNTPNHIETLSGVHTVPKYTNKAIETHIHTLETSTEQYVYIAIFRVLAPYRSKRKLNITWISYCRHA